MEVIVHASGHEHVSATHGSTVEVTTEEFLTPAGDCIVGIGADRSPETLDESFRAACQASNSVITMTLQSGDYGETIRGRGTPELTLGSDRSFVARTSTYVDDRTIMVEADKAAQDLDRDFIETLAGGADLYVTFTVNSETKTR